MKKPIQKYYFVDKLKVEQLLQLDDMRAKIFVCTGENEKSFGFLVRLTPHTISFLKTNRLMTNL